MRCLCGEPQHRHFYSIAPGVERSFIFLQIRPSVYLCAPMHTHTRRPGSHNRNGCNSSAITAQIKRVFFYGFSKVISLCFCVGASDSVWMKADESEDSKRVANKWQRKIKRANSVLPPTIKENTNRKRSKCSADSEN